MLHFMIYNCSRDLYMAEDYWCKIQNVNEKKKKKKKREGKKKNSYRVFRGKIANYENRDT